MTHSPSDSPRPTAEYRWTRDKALAFLDALAQHGKVAAAARAVGMTRQSAYRLRDRAPMIAEGWGLAQTVGRSRRKAGLKSKPASVQGDTLLLQGDGLRGAK